MKKFTFSRVLDGLRSSVSQQPRPEQEIVETLRPDNFQVTKVSSSPETFTIIVENWCERQLLQMNWLLFYESCRFIQYNLQSLEFT